MYACILGDGSKEYALGANEALGISEVKDYRTLSEFLSLAMNGGLVFKRIVVLLTVISPSYDLESLRRYCTEHSPKTEVVVVSSESRLSAVDRETLESYINLFPEPIYTDYLFKVGEQIAKVVIYDLFRASLDDIRLNHSYASGVSYQASYVNRDDSEGVSDSPTSESISVTRMVEFSDGLIKSFSFGGRIFSRKFYTRDELNAIKDLEEESNAILGLRGDR